MNLFKVTLRDRTGVGGKMVRHVVTSGGPTKAVGLAELSAPACYELHTVRLVDDTHAARYSRRALYLDPSIIHPEIEADANG